MRTRTETGFALYLSEGTLASIRGWRIREATLPRSEEWASEAAGQGGRRIVYIKLVFGSRLRGKEY